MVIEPSVAVPSVFVLMDPSARPEPAAVTAKLPPAAVPPAVPVITFCVTDTEPLSLLMLTVPAAPAEMLPPPLTVRSLPLAEMDTEPLPARAPALVRVPVLMSSAAPVDCTPTAMLPAPVALKESGPATEMFELIVSVWPLALTLMPPGAVQAPEPCTVRLPPLLLTASVPAPALTAPELVSVVPLSCTASPETEEPAPMVRLPVPPAVSATVPPLPGRDCTLSPAETVRSPPAWLRVTPPLPLMLPTVRAFAPVRLIPKLAVPGPATSPLMLA